MSGNTNTEVLIAGGFAAFAVDLLVYPLDTLKTRFQSKDYKRLYYDPTKNVLNHAAFFRGLYQGVGGIILVTLPSSGVFFTTYETIKSNFMKINPTVSGSQSPLIPQPFIHTVASAVAELASCLILTPAEVIKQNAQIAQIVRRPTASGHFSFKQWPTFKVLHNFKNPTQLFRGYTALAARNLPLTTMQFPVYEHLKETIRTRRQLNGTATGSLREIGTIAVISAGTAGSVAAFITTPLDVVKTRVMLSTSDDCSNNNSVKKPGPMHRAKGRATSLGRCGGNIDMARQLLAESGVKGLFRGAALRSASFALGGGLYLGVYETGRAWLGERRRGMAA